MADALALQCRPVAIEVHQLLVDLDPARWRSLGWRASVERGLYDRLSDRLAVLETRLVAIARNASESAIAERARDIVALLRHEVPGEADAYDGESEGAWAVFRHKLGQAYEALGQALAQQQVEVPALRPTNHTRSLVHLASALGAALLLEHVLSDRQRMVVPAVFAATFWSLEIWRRRSERANQVMMWLFRHIAHPREQHQINSSTWYATALTIISVLFPLPACAVGLVILGFADPAAGYVGRNLGRTKLVNNRTLEGSLAFFVVGTAVALGALRLWHPGLGWGASLLVAAAAALASAVAELTSRRVDDNLSIPVVAAAGAWLALTLVS